MKKKTNTSFVRVFISHATDECDLAILLKQLLHCNYPDKLDVFVSSDYEALHFGAEWQVILRDHIASCALFMILCSPRSVCRPWTNFEAGAAWIRGIPLIPLCHSGLDPDRLPKQFGMFHGGRIGDRRTVRGILSELAIHTRSASAPSGVEEFLRGVARFEHRYVVLPRLQACARLLTEFDRDWLHTMQVGKVAQLKPRNYSDLVAFQKMAEDLAKERVLKFDWQEIVPGQLPLLLLSPLESFQDCVHDLQESCARDAETL